MPLVVIINCLLGKVVSDALVFDNNVCFEGNSKKKKKKQCRDYPTLLNKTRRYENNKT